MFNIHTCLSAFQTVKYEQYFEQTRTRFEGHTVLWDHRPTGNFHASG